MEEKGKEEKERYTYLNAEFQRIARGDKKAFLNDQCKEIKENDRMGKTRDLLGVSLVHMLIPLFYLLHDDAHNLGGQNSKFCLTHV